MTHEDEWNLFKLRVEIFKRLIRTAIDNTPTTKDPHAIRTALTEINEEVTKQMLPWIQMPESGRPHHQHIKCDCGFKMDFTGIRKCCVCSKVLCHKCSFTRGEWPKLEKSKCGDCFKGKENG